MRLPLALGLFISATVLPAADETYQIARWGNTLLVTAPGGPGISPAIAAKLNQRVTVDFKDSSLTEVVDFLRSVSNINMVVAPAVTLNAQNITLQAKDMSLGNVLHWVTKLSNTHMGYLNGALFISDQPVKESSVTRMYDVSDLTMVVRDFPGPALGLNASGQNNAGGLFAPAADDTKSAPTTDEIEDIIRKVVEPGKWGN